MPALSEDELRARLRAVTELGSLKAAAKKFGVSASTMRSAIDRAEHLGIRIAESKEAPTVELPDFFDEHEPIEDVIERMSRNFERAKRATETRTWFPIKIKDRKPIGLLFVGDPHVDDNGCNWPALRQHAEICRANSAIYAVNIGDAANYWGGRLIKKYADQDTSVHTARRLVEWLLLESGFRWLLWLIGNHEHMGDAAPLLHEMNKRHGTQKVPMLDWEARFCIQFPNGSEFRINAAHNFAGSSMWNPLHGPVKAAKFGDNPGRGGMRGQAQLGNRSMGTS